MTALAIPTPETDAGIGAVLRGNWRALLVCAAMGALWLVAAVSLFGAGGLASGPGRHAAPDGRPGAAAGQGRRDVGDPDPHRHRAGKRGGDQRRHPRRRGRQSAGAAVQPRQCQRRRPRPLARMPDRRHLLRIGDRADRRPARGRPGDPQPGPPPRLSEHGLRRRLRRRAPRRPAASSASPAAARCGARRCRSIGSAPARSPRRR